MSLEYGIAPTGLVPDLDDEARLAVFDEMVDLHEEAQRERKRQAMQANAKRRFGGGRG